MDPGQLPMYSLFTAIRWPHRLRDVLSLFDSPPVLNAMDRRIWDVVTRCASYGISDNPREFHDRILFDFQANYPEDASRIRTYLEDVRSRTDLVDVQCMDALRDHAIQTVCRSMATVSDPDVLRRAVDRVRALRHVGLVSVVSGVNLFDNNGEAVLAAMPRVPIDCCVMNDLFSGLPPRGTLTLFVMPRKSGKTLLSVQLSRDCVNRGMLVLYMNFEQAAKGDLACRVYTAITGAPVDMFKGVDSLLQCPPDIRARIEQAREAWQQRFHMLDANILNSPGMFAEGIGSLYGIINSMFVQPFGRGPDLIILDWWKRFWDICSVSMKGVGKDASRLRDQEGIEFLRLKLLAEEYRSTVIVFQQMRHALAGMATNISKLSVNDSAENKALPAYADAGVVSTTKIEGTVVFKLDVDRNQDEGAIERYRMLGDRQLFVPYNTEQEQGELSMTDVSPEDLSVT